MHKIGSSILLAFVHFDPNTFTMQEWGERVERHCIEAFIYGE